MMAAVVGRLRLMVSPKRQFVPLGPHCCCFVDSGRFPASACSPSFDPSICDFAARSSSAVTADAIGSAVVMIDVWSLWICEVR